MDIRDLQLADFSDPAIHRWGERILMESELSALATAEQNVLIRRALETPWLYGPAEAAALLRQFVDLYERVVGNASGHALDIGRQPFQGMARLFAPHAPAAHGRASSSLTDSVLFARYGDVATAAEHLLQRADLLSGKCVREGNRRELDAIATLLSAIADQGRDRPALARQLLARVEMRLQKLQIQIPASGERLDTPPPLRSDEGDGAEVVAEWQQQFDRALSTDGEHARFAKRAENFYQHRRIHDQEMVYEEMIPNPNDVQGWNRRGTAGAAEVMARTEDPFFSNALASLEAQFERDAPNAALAFLRSFSLRPSYAGTIALTAVAGKRFGHTSELVREGLQPQLFRNLASDLLPQAELSGALEDAAPLPERLPLLLEQSARSGRRIHLEFGGGFTPWGAAIAIEQHDDMVISIDPQAGVIPWKKTGIVRAPHNFFFLRGFAEEAALFAHDGPFAESATIVNPQSFNLPRLLLSALLSVRPGGTIDIVHRELEHPEKACRKHYAWVEKLGATVEMHSSPWDALHDPYSGSFREGEDIIHVRITVPTFPAAAAETTNNSAIGSDERANTPLHVLPGSSAAGDLQREAARTRIAELSAMLQKEFDFRLATRQPLPMAERVLRRDLLRDTDRDWIPEQRRMERPGADRLFDAATELVGLHLQAESPEHIAPLLKEFALPKAYGRAILLSGAYAFRVGAENDFYRTLFYPAIVRPIISSRPPLEPVAFDDALVATVEATLPSLLATAEQEGREIHLEFGGFMTPDGIRIANEQPELLVASIDPTASVIESEFMPTTAQYGNFIHLRGYAEEIAPWAALNPFAASASIVAPSPASLHALMLSALLAVRPGGTITIFSLERESLDIPFLDRLDLPVEQRSFRWSLQEGPYSTYLQEGEIVTRTDIRVRAFGETGRGSTPPEGSADAKGGAAPNAPSGHAASAAHFAGFVDDPAMTLPPAVIQLLLQEGTGERDVLLDATAAPPPPTAPSPAAAAGITGRPAHLPKAK